MKINLFRLIIFITILFYLISLTKVQSFNSIKYFLLPLIIVVFILHKQLKVKVIKKINFVFILQLFLFVLYPLLYTNYIFSLQTLSYSIISFLFIIVIFLIASVCNSKNQVVEFNKRLFIVLSAFLIVMYLLNFSSLLSINNILNAFNLQDRSRATYGFIHPNFLGGACYINLLIFVYLLLNKQITRRKSIVYFTIIGFTILLLLNCGSRGAIFSFTIFITLLIVFKLIPKVNMLLRCVVLSLYGLIMVIAFRLLVGYNFTNLIDATNRSDNWSLSLNYMVNQANIYTGVGYVNPNYFYNSVYKFLGTDNWFLYTFITQGIIGIIVVLAIIIVLLINAIKIKHSNDRFFYISFIFSFIFYSFFENIFFNPSLLISLYFWIMLFMLSKQKIIAYNVTV